MVSSTAPRTRARTGAPRWTPIRNEVQGPRRTRYRRWARGPRRHGPAAGRQRRGARRLRPPTNGRRANYAAARGGLQGRARRLAIERGPFNVSVNTVAPGFVETRMTRATAERMGMDFETFKLGAASQIPLRRIGQPGDIANVIAFLCSDESGFVSGQTIYARGGP